MFNGAKNWIEGLLSSWIADEFAKRTPGPGKGSQTQTKGGGDDPKDSFGGLGLGDEADAFNQAAGKLKKVEGDILTTRLDEIWTTHGREEVEQKTNQEWANHVGDTRDGGGPAHAGTAPFSWENFRDINNDPGIGKRSKEANKSSRNRQHKPLSKT